MTLQAVANYVGPILGALPSLPHTLAFDVTNQTTDAVGESVTFIGYVQLTSGPGTSKTISSAGGKIYWKSGASVTFANASTNLRVGIQDVGATGIEDGTFDVQGNLVGGTDTIATNSVQRTAMASGTKTIVHGDLIAVSLELTGRGGADSVQIQRNTVGGGGISPYVTADSGSGPVKLSGALPMCAIEFDDGTFGFFGFDSWPYAIEDSAEFNSGSTPDEYALVFQVLFKCGVVAVGARLINVAAIDDFEFILYSDPLGTPAAMTNGTIAQDMDLGEVRNYWERSFAGVITLEPNTNYALAYRPTTTNNAAFGRLNLGTGNAALRAATMFGVNCAQYSRTNQTGAFASAATTLIPLFWLRLGQLSDDVGGGSGGGMRLAGHGGLAA